MSQKIAVAKSGVDASLATDPNDFIYHSDFNTFKIIGNNTVDFTIPANSSAVYTVNHGLEIVPLTMAFLRQDSVDAVISQNNSILDVLGLGYYLFLEQVGADYTQLKFTISNHDVSNSHVAHMRYWLFEVPL
jgi:hypothetical protein